LGSTPASACPFCTRVAGGVLLASNDGAAAFPDAFPLSPGHTLIVPRRHVGDLFALTAGEQAALWLLLPEVKALLDGRHGPAGYNVGVNVGAAAGQTVEHVHVHLVPRYPGDVPDPRGGVRWIIPGRAAYWDRKA
jgi:diadenosine tetraphosphate (Ap4A) HIT family hydrolase